MTLPLLILTTLGALGLLMVWASLHRFHRPTRTPAPTDGEPP
ncbi:hypothetical protein [Streptomyces sp. 8L]|nr:hypothetical protein [Streptomyces sp. 8L]